MSLRGAAIAPEQFVSLVTISGALKKLPKDVEILVDEEVHIVAEFRR